jgi:transcriptional regulator with XRE-family HTH domain
VTGLSRFRADPARPFEVALASALARANMTRRAAARGAGLDEGTIGRWGRGERQPFADQLKKLVAVLGAPELFDTIEARQRLITMRCTACGEVTIQQPGVLRGSLNSGQFSGAVVDWPGGTGSWTCVRCKQRTAGHASPVGRRNTTLRKRHGKAGLIAQGRALAATLTPEQRKEYSELAWQANRGREQGQAERERHKTGSTWPTARLATELMATFAKPVGGPVGKWGYCAGCGQILYSRKPERPGLFHGPCQLAYRRQSYAFGPPPPPPLDRVPHRPRQPEDLAEAFALAVLKLLRGVPRPVLAAVFGLTERGVDDRIDRFVARLPEDDRGGPWLTYRAFVLRGTGNGS